MDRAEAKQANIIAQRQAVAPIIHTYCATRGVKPKTAAEALTAVLAAILHLCDQDGVNFNDALAKARIKVLGEKRPV